MVANRGNPLALAVMCCLLEHAMHPYEVATTLRQRAKERSVKLNYGALYGVVDSLRKRGLIEAKETRREGMRPERTVYELTASGRAEVTDWLAELLQTPVTEYPQFVAALSFLPALAPDEAVHLLEARLVRLRLEQAGEEAARELVQKVGLPRLLWLEEEFRGRLRATELEYVRELVRDIRSGALEGTDWWRLVHERGPEQVPPPFDNRALHDNHPGED